MNEIPNSDVFYQYFLEALHHFLNKDGWGGQSSLAASSGLSESAISQILNGTRKASFKSQVKISSGCGYSYSGFLELGRKLLGNENIDNIISDQPTTKIVELQTQHKPLTDNRLKAMITNLITIYESGNKSMISTIETNLNSFVELTNLKKTVGYQRKKIGKQDGNTKPSEDHYINYEDTG